jgi:hypothetical protein
MCLDVKDRLAMNALFQLYTPPDRAPDRVRRGRARRGEQDLELLSSDLICGHALTSPTTMTARLAPTLA